MTDTNDTGPVPAVRTVQEVAQLFEVAGREADALRLLDDGVAQLHEIARANSALAQLSGSELRAALEVRAATLRGELA